MPCDNPQRTADYDAQFELFTFRQFFARDANKDVLRITDIRIIAQDPGPVENATPSWLTGGFVEALLFGSDYSRLYGDFSIPASVIASDTTYTVQYTVNTGVTDTFCIIVGELPAPPGSGSGSGSGSGDGSWVGLYIVFSRSQGATQYFHRVSVAGVGATELFSLSGIGLPNQIAVDPVFERIYSADQDAEVVRRWNADGTGQISSGSSGTSIDPSAVDVDPGAQKVFAGGSPDGRRFDLDLGASFALDGDAGATQGYRSNHAGLLLLNDGGGALKSCDYNGDGIQTIIMSGFPNTDDWCVDWVNRNVYAISSDDLYRWNIDTGAGGLLVSDLATGIRGFDVDPGNGRLYVSIFNGGILAFDLDGSPAGTILSTAYAHRGLRVWFDPATLPA